MINFSKYYFKDLKDKTFAIVDIETTGGRAYYERVIEIGIIRIENGVVTKNFQTLLNPEKSLSYIIQNITGIQNEALLNAPLFEDKAEEIHEILKDAIFVAHNVRFDYGFIKNEFRRVGIIFNEKCLCSVRLSRRLFSRHKRHDLSTIIKRFDIKCIARHRAMGDALAVLDFFHSVHNSGRGKEMSEAIDILLKRTTFPPFLNEKTVGNLPRGPGVYKFFGEDDELLYVGKSKSLRYRIFSHFSNDHTTSKEMNLCQKTKRVEYIETVGEFGALLLESKLIKDLAPLYNRQLRKKTKLVILRQVLNGNYYSVETNRIDKIPTEDYESVLGVFKSNRQATEFLRKVSKELKLCPKILGLEKTKGACFYSQINLCGGACLNKENVDEFNQKFSEAFKSRKLRSWPYKKGIIIEEVNHKGEKHSFVIDNWCLVGEITTNSEDVQSFSEPIFDYDSYKIFTRFLSNPENKRVIKPININDFNMMLNREDTILI